MFLVLNNEQEINDEQLCENGNYFHYHTVFFNQ